MTAEDMLHFSWNHSSSKQQVFNLYNTYKEKAKVGTVVVCVLKLGNNSILPLHKLLKTMYTTITKLSLLSFLNMIIMQSLDLAIKACVCVKKIDVCLTVACYELNN